MSLVKTVDFDASRAKPITLAGKEYVIAPLPLRQVLALADLLPKLSDIKIENLTGEMFEPVIEMLRRGLLKVYPDVTTDDLLDMDISIADLMAAIPVIVEQAGGRRIGAAGEAKATGQSDQTGTGSSPN